MFPIRAPRADSRCRPCDAMTMSPALVWSAAASTPRNTSVGLLHRCPAVDPCLSRDLLRPRQPRTGLGAYRRLVVGAGNRTRFADRAVRIGRCHCHRGQAAPRRRAASCAAVSTARSEMANRQSRRGLVPLNIGRPSKPIFRQKKAERGSLSRPRFTLSRAMCADLLAADLADRRDLGRHR